MEVSIIRSGQRRKIHYSELVVGDIVILESGMDLPVDGYLIQANEVTIDESAMTGEGDPIKKNALAACIKKRVQIDHDGRRNTASAHEVPSPILLSGTKVITGEGIFIVTMVGENSTAGKIKGLLNKEENELTPLQEKLEGLANSIGKFGLYSAIIIFAALLLRWGIERAITQKWNTGYDLGLLLNYVLVGVCSLLSLLIS